MIKAIIFDCYGVIYNDAAKVAFDELGGNKLENKQFYHDALAKLSSGMIDVDEMHREMAIGLGVDVDSWKTTLGRFSGRDKRLMELILSVKQEYKTALLSNIGHGRVDVLFPGDEQQKYFDVVVASADEGVMKPDPEIYELTLQRLGVKAKEAVFIDDNIYLVQAAEQVGIKGIRFTSYSELVSELKAILNA